MIDSSLYRCIIFPVKFSEQKDSVLPVKTRRRKMHCFLLHIFKSFFSVVGLGILLHPLCFLFLFLFLHAMSWSKTLYNYKARPLQKLMQKLQGLIPQSMSPALQLQGRCCGPSTFCSRGPLCRICCGCRNRTHTLVLLWKPLTHAGARMLA